MLVCFILGNKCRSMCNELSGCIDCIDETDDVFDRRCAGDMSRTIIRLSLDPMMRKITYSEENQ